MTGDSRVVGLRLEVLCFIADKYEPDVAALQAEYKQRHDEEIPYQRMYNTVESLEGEGLVEKKPLDGLANCYMLTNKGAEFLNSHYQFVSEHTEVFQKASE